MAVVRVAIWGRSKLVVVCTSLVWLINVGFAVYSASSFFLFFPVSRLIGFWDWVAVTRVRVCETVLVTW